MVNQELVDCIRRTGSRISVEELFYGQLDILISKGLRVLTLCNDGVERSAVVAEQLNSYGIPSVRLSGGIKQFFENETLVTHLSAAQSVINKSPNVAVILTPSEMSDYASFLSNLKCSRYSRSRVAITSIKMVES